MIVCPPVCPQCCAQTCLSEEVRWGEGCWPIQCYTPLCRPLGPCPGIQVTHKGEEGCRECAVQRPKYNSPEALLLLLLLPRGSCQPGGAQPRVRGPRPQPARPQPGPRASTALTEPPPQLEPRTPPPAGSAQRQPCNHIFRSVNATPDRRSIVLPCFSSASHRTCRPFNATKCGREESSYAAHHCLASQSFLRCVGGAGVHRWWM